MSPLESVVSDKDKRETLSNHLQIPQAQAGAFWKLYEDYERERRSLFRERLKLVNKYAEARSDAAPVKQVRTLGRRLLLNDVEYREMYRSYYTRVSLIVGPEKALQFIHIEEQFQVRTNTRLERIIYPQNYFIASKQKQMD